MIRAARTPKEARDSLMTFITPAEAKAYAAAVGAAGPQFTERQAQARSARASSTRSTSAAVL